MSNDRWKAAIEHALDQPHWERVAASITVGFKDAVTDIMAALEPMRQEHAEMVELLREVSGDLRSFIRSAQCGTACPSGIAGDCMHMPAHLLGAEAMLSRIDGRKEG